MAIHKKQYEVPAEQNTEVRPAIFVIFGITGDLAQRRLLPALYHLLKDKLLDERTQIVGISRQAIDEEELLNRIELCVLEEDKVCDPDALKDFRNRFQMLQLDPVRSEDYGTLRTTLEEIEEKHSVCMNRLYYLSIPPQIYDPVIQNLGQSGLATGCKHQHTASRLLVEKPFGHDLASAKELIARTSQHFDETQLFRIDHYLAKETVQNILVFRQQNPIFADLWSNKHVRSIDIVMHEQIGVEGRRAFYDNTGALRDVVQNHLLQLLALVTMELPDPALGDTALHDAKKTLLEQLTPVDTRREHIVTGQYKGYKEEIENPRSTTETYVSLTLSIDNDRWRRVPITITTGKALTNKKTAITLAFASPTAQTVHNALTFRIQPNEGIDIELIVKRPGFDNKTEVVHMDFSYRGVFNEPEHPDAYERVLVDAIKGDHSLFATSDEIIAAWRVLQPILDAWEQHAEKNLIMYDIGSEGPAGTI